MTCQCPTCGSPIAHIGIVVNLNDNTVTTEKGIAHLTPSQAEIAEMLVKRYPAYVHTESMMAGLYGNVDDHPTYFAVKVQISKMKAKLKEVGLEIECVYSRGYRMAKTS